MTDQAIQAKQFAELAQVHPAQVARNRHGLPAVLSLDNIAEWAAVATADLSDAECRLLAAWHISEGRRHA